MYRKIAPSRSWIVYDDNPVMKQEIKDVTFPLTKDDEEIVLKMRIYIDASFDDKGKKYDIQPGIGIAAIQLGYPKKIIYIRLMQDNQEKKYLLANPKKISESTKKMYLSAGEGCLSVKKNHEGYSIRKAIVIVEGIDLLNNNKKITVRANGLLAACFQHELDHNNNMFYYNRINKNNPYYTEKDWISLDR